MADGLIKMQLKGTSNRLLKKSLPFSLREKGRACPGMG
jgi:hypothetical protein